jgi:hypothetical protein
VSAHHRGELGEIWRTAGCGIHNRGGFPEVVRAEDAGGDNRKRGGVHFTVVVEAMHGSAGDVDNLSGADGDRFALDRPGEHPFEAVDGLLIAVVAVGGRKPRPGRNVELENGDRASRGLSLDEEPDRDRLSVLQYPGPEACALPTSPLNWA